jgi:murein DD-endopeptidase MepM/ murein hydrolase activator NlpD
MVKNPVKNFNPAAYPKGDVTQFFGENKDLYAKLCDALGCLTGGHNGIDIVRPWGEPIYSVTDGKAVEVLEDDHGYGKHVKILSTDNWEWVYGHLSKIEVKLGDVVTAGQEIGLMGNTGFVVSGATPFWKDNPYAGTHLHIGKRQFVPRVADEPYNIQYGTGDKGTIANYQNGFKGAVDCITDFEGYTPPQKPTHLFTRDLEFGMTNDSDVKALQDILRYEGLFASESTGNYFTLTAQAVKKYQLKYGLITTWQGLINQGKYCYQIPRHHLNQKYGG